MALTPDERSRIRTHLGYMSVGQAASMQLGIPRPAQTLWLVEDAMSLLLPQAEPRVRQILATMDRIECLLDQAPTHFAAARVDGLELRENEADLLEKEYVRWGCRLADVLGCPIYPYSNRYQGRVGGGVNVKVVG